MRNPGFPVLAPRPVSLFRLRRETVLNTPSPNGAVSVSDLLARARVAQQGIDGYSQDQVDVLTRAVGWSVVRPQNAEALARQAVQEGRLGNFEDKLSKIRNRVIGVLADMADTPTVGIVEENPQRGLVKIAKPVGVVAALVPVTGPDATPPLKALMALKGRNAIVFAAHPRTQGTTELAVGYMRAACRQVGAPENLIQVIDQPGMARTRELMQAADLIVATGGEAMVKAAYGSGTPAFGVGVGNSVHVVDQSAIAADAAAAISTAKTFDYATSCLADNAVVAHADIFDLLVRELTACGGYRCSRSEKTRLQAAMWPDPSASIPALEIIGRPAAEIAAAASISLPPDRRFLIVDEEGTGAGFPFSGEKLSVVLSLFRYSGGIENAVALVNEITRYQGAGHTCGIHSQRDDNVRALALGTRTGRVLVNQSLNGGAGSPGNGLPYTLSLGCGTWGGNITTENINVRHMLNLTWLCYPVPRREFSEQSVFQSHWERFGK